MPLYEASWAVVVIWSRMLLYWLTRLARFDSPFGSCTGALPARPLNSLPEAAAVPPIVPMVADAASLVVLMVSAPLALSEACRLLADRALFKSLRDFT